MCINAIDPAIDFGDQPFSGGHPRDRGRCSREGLMQQSRYEITDALEPETVILIDRMLAMTMTMTMTMTTTVITTAPTTMTMTTARRCFFGAIGD